MVAKLFARRSDDYLESILYETANWTVNGAWGIVLCEVASFRLALEKAMEFTCAGREVVALVRKRNLEIIVFSNDVERLAKHLSKSEIFQEHNVNTYVDENIRLFDGVLSALKADDRVCRETVVQTLPWGMEPGRRDPLDLVLVPD